ncbi:D-xylose ABC transporter ATP-binding protein [Carnobacterium maltaromaticum]|uniref:sugar ABC transporter ATP-binding protein n=1 Tax=Carnobacterium maltaromaticum TaxID=2751 RepID=UPI000C771C43|nr:sugar ABC transporter ATP-binding protein [Carnobacterium maltaromaticum]PLS37047.1 D-xylose ABC transporter ATP-binding protein [Carnobacterium maltaromaticum]PLS37861.1 D-xylose ABC transporter ATP-binding protein [Carnobacterium maltaromaticum]PLS39802.1 D-xylose ABC transporter ATP-binding protein [Carnobacterium maltaromaticum]PLS44558.1 D-xylose ABC transporter ATP-binding protein [Carnobacterium maltaromaticum]PLS46591.1 D-xylose ABC transporter ATP-binding protein [Carnobacterium ma
MEVIMKNIYKAFGTNAVLEGVNFDTHGGEIHALMGENGAGKSTMMNILTGMHKKDQGTILINGKEHSYTNPKEAEEHGVSFIHQEMNTWPQMTVLENLFIGKEMKNKIGFIRSKEMKTLALKTFKELGITMDLDADVQTLSVGQQQMIEIAKALMTDCQVLIMDEPTAALTDREIRMLFKIIQHLKTKEVAIIYISHRMEEIFEISDRITVMRDGMTVDTTLTKETNVDDVVRKMVGREISDYYPKKNAEIGETVFEVKNLSGTSGFENISFSVKSGEIVGFSGLMGAGRTEIMRGIFGIDPISQGEIFLEGKKVQLKNPSTAIKAGVGFLTENRKEEGLVLDFSIKDNISLPSIDEFRVRGLIDTKTEDEFVQLLMKRLTVKAQNEDISAGSLSDGNQQKVVLAKWIGIGPKVLILDEPTRGVDVGAKREIYQLMNELAERGVAIVIVSSDLPEVLGVSDRILVVHEGKIAGELSRTEATQEKIMNLATGGK